MPLRIKKRPIAEDIRQRTGKYAIHFQATCPRAVCCRAARLQTEHTKQQPRKIKAQQNDGIIIQVHVPHRNENSPQRKRVTDRIIMERLQHITAFPDIKIPRRKGQPMPGKQLFENPAQISGIVYKRLIMLHPAVPVPDQRPPLEKIPGKHKKGHCRK